MKILVLAAGRSKRMKPVEDKNFLDFLGKSLLQRQLEMILGIGFEEIILVAGAHNLEKIKKLCADVSDKILVTEQKDLEAGMCGAILAAKDYLGENPLMVFSSNDVVEKEAFELINKAFKKEDADGYMIGKKVSKYFPGGYLSTDKAGFIENIVEKPEPGTEPSNLINLVIHLHKNPSKLISYLEKTKSKNDDRYEVAISNMLKDGIKMRAVPYEGFWQPIKFPWHITKVAKYYFEKEKKGVAKSAVISEKAVVKGDVIIGENVKIFEGAIVNGPAYIGDNTIIANNALVRESFVGENCVIGYSTEIARSYLGSEVWTHSNYIGDSVLGNNVSFGSGTVTGNLRLDEENVRVDYDGNWLDTGTAKFGLITGDNIRVGVNTSFMPGVKVGSDCFIGAGIVIGGNIAENSFVRGKFELKISENKMKIDKDRSDFKKKL